METLRGTVRLRHLELERRVIRDVERRADLEMTGGCREGAGERETVRGNNQESMTKRWELIELLFVCYLGRCCRHL